VGIIGVAFIVIYFGLILLIIEISVAVLVITGLESDVARFQAVSMLTATGFTTKESELIARHPIRRKLSIFLILFGVFSLAVLIASITKVLTENFRVPQLIIITIFFGIIYLAVKNKTINQKLKGKFVQDLKEEFALDEMPVQEILYTSEEDFFTGVEISKDSPYVDHKFSDVIRPEQDIMLLLVRRGERKIRESERDYTIQEGDVLYLYGSKKEIESKFKNEINQMKMEKADEHEAITL
jgi:uncharacterized membrane protein YqjE